jgi:hypothetical protein
MMQRNCRLSKSVWILSNWPKVRANKSWVTVCGVNSPPFGNGL